MNTYKKYILHFLVYGLVFVAVMLLVDWAFIKEIESWYQYLFQGVFFGIFMTVYTYWGDKRKSSAGK